MLAVLKWDNYRRTTNWSRSHNLTIPKAHRPFISPRKFPTRKLVHGEHTSRPGARFATEEERFGHRVPRSTTPDVECAYVCAIHTFRWCSRCGTRLCESVKVSPAVLVSRKVHPRVVVAHLLAQNAYETKLIIWRQKGWLWSEWRCWLTCNKKKI